MWQLEEGFHYSRELGLHVFAYQWISSSVHPVTDNRAAMDKKEINLLGLIRAQIAGINRLAGTIECCQFLGYLCHSLVKIEGVMCLVRFLGPCVQKTIDTLTICW